MIPGAIKVESTGSFWWIDEVGMRYLRTPKHEGPRTDWPSDGVLTDLMWLPMESWEIDTDCPGRGGEFDCLHIVTSDPDDRIHAPIPKGTPGRTEQ